MDVLKKVPVREQKPEVRAKNFEEVCYGYNDEEAVEEAQRCINCKNARCIQGCPVSIDIPSFISKIKEGEFEAAYQDISKYTALPGVCGRVLRENRFLLESWSVFFLIKRQKKVIHCQNQQEKMVIKWQS